MNASLDKAKETPVGSQKHVEEKAAASDVHVEGKSYVASIKVINASLFLYYSSLFSLFSHYAIFPHYLVKEGL